MIKIGDHLQPTEQARVNYGFDALGIKLPIVAINVFRDSEGIEYVQFLSPSTYKNCQGLIIRTWNARNLVPHKPKPRCKLVPVASLRVGDQVWSRVESKWHTIGLIGYATSQKPGALWEDSRYVWKQTTLQTDPGEQGGRGLFDISPVSGQHPDDLSGLAGQARLDEGAGGADTVPREGYSSVADYVQATAQPRATVRMTKGRDIKPGDRISCVVAHDQARKVNYFHAGPFGAAVLIEPDLYYMVVNDITK